MRKVYRNNSNYKYYKQKSQRSFIIGNFKILQKKFINKKIHEKPVLIIWMNNITSELVMGKYGSIMLDQMFSLTLIHPEDI